MIPTIIDISWLNGEWADWPQNSPVTGAVLKAAEGIQIDPYFVRNARFLKNKTRVSAFAYFRPCRSDAFRYIPWQDWIDCQAELFCTQYRAAGLVDQGLPSYLDHEDSDKEKNKWGAWVYISHAERLERIRRWLEYVRNELNILPGLYNGFFRWNELKGEKQWAAEYPLIMPMYPYDKAKDFETIYRKIISGEMPLVFPKPPAPWTHITVWQWTGHGKTQDVPGHPAGKLAVDMNVEYSAPVEPPPHVRVIITCNVQNVRSGPGVEYQRVSSVARNDILNVYETQIGWGRIGDQQWIYIGKPYNQEYYD